MADVYTRIGYIKGDTGATGATGAKGDQGDAATIEVGTVTTVPYGQTANVVNSGTSGAAVFDFTIPQGKPGEQTTDMQNLTLGSITTSSASFPVPAVGETGKVLWGKVVKWFSDMSALVATKLNISSVVNNLTTTESGYALDARQGHELADRIINVSNVFTLEKDAMTTAQSYVTIGSMNNVLKYGRIVQVTIVFAVSQNVTGDTAILTTPYQIRFPFIASIRKDLGGEYLIGTIYENTNNIRALYGEGLPSGTYRGTFSYITI